MLVAIRSFKGIPFYYGSPDHFSIYLLNYGWTKWQVLGYVWILSLILLIASLLFLNNTLSLGNMLGSGLLFLIIWMSILFNGLSAIKKIRNFLFSRSLNILKK